MSDDVRLYMFECGSLKCHVRHRLLLFAAHPTLPLMVEVSRPVA